MVHLQSGYPRQEEISVGVGLFINSLCVSNGAIDINRHANAQPID